MATRSKHFARIPVYFPPEMRSHLEALVATEEFKSLSDAAVHGVSHWLYGLGARLRAAEALVAAQSGPDRAAKVIEFAPVGSRGRVSRAG